MCRPPDLSPARGALGIFLVHPGGSFWVKQDAGAWSIPKGEFELSDDPLVTVEREFTRRDWVCHRWPVHRAPSTKQRLRGRWSRSRFALPLTGIGSRKI
jgi:predicted NUDIX family NTP pyrophosphohydrolase